MVTIDRSARASRSIDAWRSLFSVDALRRAFVGGSVAWAAALPLATLAASRAAGSSFLAALAFAVYATGAVLCHQRPERSFFIASHQMPVCARCTGLYLGAAVAVLLVARLKGTPPRILRTVGTPPPRAPSVTQSGRARSSDGARGFSRARTVLALAAMPTLATLGYEWMTGVTPANWIRAAAGVCLGAAVAALIQREVN